MTGTTEEQGAHASPETGDVAVRLSSQEVERLYDEFGQELLAFLVGVTRNADLAQEALQCTFQRVLERGHTARIETIRGWLFRVAFHEAMGVRRKRQGHADVIERYAGSGLSRLVPAVEDELVQQETVTRLRELLDKLPPDQRDVVERRMHREQTFAEIAAELNLPLGTVLTRMRLATQRLQRWLQSNE